MDDERIIKVLSSSDGTSHVVHISLKATLKELKEKVSLETSIEPKYQRLFHLGREIKNCRRSLNALGVGRYNSFVLHLHSTQPKNHNSSNGNSIRACSGSSSASGTSNSNDDNGVSDDEICIVDGNSALSSSSSTSNDGRRRQKREVNLISGGGSNESSYDTDYIGNASTAIASFSASKNEKEVVDLLDSDDDDDDIEVVEVKTSNKRRRSR